MVIFISDFSRIHITNDVDEILRSTCCFNLINKLVNKVSQKLLSVKSTLYKGKRYHFS